ncbi:MAG: S1/P1 nuclease [Candidatus Riflebacteria bacterium]|nr:S1/P1 nuclease [Candidatus Riflebacteria bacterium]
MKSFVNRLSAIVVMIVILGPGFPAAAWNAKGHRLVAGIAESLLRPEVRNEVQSILATETFVGVAKWADDIRPSRPFTAPYHYVDVPSASFKSIHHAIRTGRPREREGTLPDALEHFGKALADTSRSLDERQEALKFFIHLMGDLHQPMHCSPPGDSGGNELQVTLKGQVKNLHRVWDTDLIAALGGSEKRLLTELSGEAAKLDAVSLASGTFLDWARESGDLAVKYAYSFPEDGVLSQEYMAVNAPIVRVQLEKAGVRLAAFLNRELCKPHRK